MQRGAVIGLAARGNVRCPLSHTRALTCGHTHTGALTCSHIPTHTCIHAQSALTFILHAPPLMLTSMRVLPSGGKLVSVLEVQAPKAASSMEPFPRPHITSQSPGCVPGPTPGCPQSPGSWMLLGKASVASGFGWGTGSPRSEGVQKGTDQLALHHGARGLTTPISPDLKSGGGRIPDRPRPGVASGSTDTGSQPWGAGPPGEGVLGRGTWGEESCRRGILYVTRLDPLGVLRELLQKKWVVQTVLSPAQPPCDPDQSYGEEPGQEEDRPSRGHGRARG